MAKYRSAKVAVLFCLDPRMSRAPHSIPGVLTAIVISFVVVTYALSFALTALAIITTQLGPNLLRLNGVLPVYLFALISLRIIPANGLILITVLMAIFSACFWAAAIDRGGFIASLFFFSSRRRHTRWTGDWSSDVCSSD